MPVHLPVVDPPSTLRGDGARVTVHTSDVSGRFTRARRVVAVLLLAVFVLTPWLTVGGRPVLLLDLPRRSFYVLGHVFNAQDVFLVFFLVTGAAYALVAATTLLGRLWCGWACPQTIYLEMVYRPLQRLVEGTREQRLRREARGWTWARAWRRVLLWTLYLVLSSLIAHQVLAYFVPVRSVVALLREGPAQHMEAFLWAQGITLVVFFDLAWFREQTCVALCPYGRLQGVLLDPDSLVIGYDARRGEPRGKATDPDAGACVDCKRCVTVCPGGIDIRNGLQLDCITCAQCIDACDAVMDRLGRPRGLIRYDSQRGLVGEPRRWLRPRLYLYAGLGLLGLLAATLGLRRHTPFEANLLRLPGAPYTLDQGVVRNAYEIHLVNKRPERRTFTVEPAEAPGVVYVLPLRTVTLASLAQVRLPVFVEVPRAGFHGDFPVRLRVVPQGQGAEARSLTAPFLGPGR
ncbi:MAG: cytochrome c oxidase accessory protein CcoG [Deltaproteobacteria bacterium]|nr:cytochrome c oxidase accessory protein CcoG [Deltaproteobacteria bacterium]